MKALGLAAAAWVVACSSPPARAPEARIIVVVTVDWEGDALTPDASHALAELRTQLGADVPLTHFVCPAYLARAPAPSPTELASSVRKGDEVAVHLHAWQSLAQAAKIEPRTSPSLLDGTDGLVEFTHHDSGFDLDLDTYDIASLRAMLRTSRKLLEDQGFSVSRSFRAGGYLGTPKVMLAARSEGFTVDSSALSPEELAALPADEQYFHDRVAQVWPRLERTAQPFYLDAKSKQILEMPIAAVADFSSAEQIQDVFAKAYARLQQHDQDVFVVLALHYETAPDFASEIADAIAKVRSDSELARHLTFARLDQAALLARFAP